MKKGLTDDEEPLIEPLIEPDGTDTELQKQLQKLSYFAVGGGMPTDRIESIIRKNEIKGGGSDDEGSDKQNLLPHKTKKKVGFFKSLKGGAMKLVIGAGAGPAEKFKQPKQPKQPKQDGYSNIGFQNQP